MKVTLPATLEIIPEGCFNLIEAEIDFPNSNPRYSCENGFLIDRDTQTLLYTAPVEPRQSAARRPPSGGLFADELALGRR